MINGSVVLRKKTPLDLGSCDVAHEAYEILGYKVILQLLQGSAPFITYCSFFELLKLPKKLMMTGKSEKRMRCRSYLAIIQFELGSKELGASVPTQVKQLSAEFAPGTSDLPNENLQNVTGCLVNNDMIQWSDDYDNSSYHFNDSKLASPSKS
ncbi:hypothetical protein T459_12426 [Capsicum annuum]|uniref:Probable zinc-ribbon domain-containing protein n=1 Tax=Capsicum annuum TaxID=4072 RepID=A0A2G2ZPS8_CAPAN|nr:hypothetical protein T459_12426 [Capsicum annuum]